jgi:hypothetical protein
MAVVKTHLGYPKPFYFLLTKLEGLASLPGEPKHVLCSLSKTFFSFLSNWYLNFDMLRIATRGKFGSLPTLDV